MVNEVDRIQDQIVRSLEGGAWHGPSLLELLTGIKRAGADFILTYHAKDAAQWLK